MTAQFRHLPPFGEYILQFRFMEYLDTIKQVSTEVKVPLLKYFEEMPREELERLTYESGKRFLTAIKNSQFKSFIEEGKTSWLQNQLPIISRDQVVVEDITLVNYCRRRALRNMVSYYTQDLSTVLELCDEIDWFMMMNDSALFSTYIGIQQDNLEKINQSLVKREQQLLEAQRIAHIGSFEWDLTMADKSTFTAEVYKIFEFDRSNGLENFMLDVHPEDQQKLRQAIKQSMISGIYDCEYRYIRNRNLKYIWSRGVVHYDNGRPISITGTVADITEKAVLFVKLKEAEELSKQAQALSNTGNWKWTIANQNIDWSDEMYRIYGLAPQSEKITFERFLSFIHPEDRQRRAKEIVIAIETGFAADYNMRIINPDGAEKVLRGKGKVITDESGKALVMVGTCQDITMEYGLSAELLARNEELTRKNKELESFNFIASHDLQEPLRKIQLYSSRLTAEHDENLPPGISHLITRITSAAESLQAMIKDFLCFSQYSHDEENCSTIDLNILIKRILSGYDMLIAESGMECKVTSLPVIYGRPNQIYQALRSLVSNALKFHDPTKKPLLKIDCTVIEKQGRSYYKICFTDNGIGFEPHYKERIFEVFQRLHAKDEYPGSGVGLSVAKKIVEDHHGFIEAETRPGSGSVFSVFLPMKN